MMNYEYLIMIKFCSRIFASSGNSVYNSGVIYARAIYIGHEIFK